ncbi:MAG: SRPBCC domain-containing protein, partial [Myxococcota bacterium]
MSSSMTISESFTARAPRSVVYAFLRDPARCFPCLPGASYGSTDADGKFTGAITVRVGPVTMAYDGWGVYEGDDPEFGRLVINGQGREKSGSGVVKMAMTCTLVEQDGTTQVAVSADVGLGGAIVRLGRGMIKGVSAQVFKEFAAAATAQLEAE